jgi:hypothetical protein
MMSDINVVKSTANGYAVIPDMLVTLGSANVPFAVVTTADWPRVKVQNLIDGTLQSVDGSELVAAPRDQLPFVVGQEVYIHFPDGTLDAGKIETIVGEHVDESGDLLSPLEWSFGVTSNSGIKLPFLYLHSISCSIVKAEKMATTEFETSAPVADEEGEISVPKVEAPTKVKRVRKPKAKPEAPVFVNPLAMSAEELRQNALDRITKPGVVAIAAGHGLIRIRSKGESTVMGITATHVEVEVPFGDLAPATKSQVDQYRELFKEVAKTVPVPFVVGAPVATKGKPKKLLGYVAEVANDYRPYLVALVDGSDESTYFERDQLVPFTGKEPRFADVPLFGAFIFKGKTHVKVAKSNAIAVEVKGLSNSPVAVLATESSKLGSAAFKRFKKDDRVQIYGPNLPILAS